MLTEDFIKNLSNLELRNELIKYQIKCGPVEPSTRSLYEKKLIKHLKQIKAIKQAEVVPGSATNERVIKMDINNNEVLSPIVSLNTSEPRQQPDLDSLSDDKILSLLRANNLPCGPVNISTRSVYIKKLKSHLNSSNANVSRLDETPADDGNAQVPVSLVQNVTSNFDSEPDIAVIEEKSLPPRKQQVIDERAHLKIKPLEFRLIQPSLVNQVRFEQNESQPFSSQSTSFGGYDRSYLSYEPDRGNYSFTNEQYDYNLTNRNRPLIKQSNLFDKDYDIHPPVQTSYTRNVVRQNIYSEAAPLQPVHLTKINQQTSMAKIVHKYRYFILIGFALLFFVAYLLVSPVPVNPIENI